MLYQHSPMIVCNDCPQLFPSVSFLKLQLWSGYYLRWNPKLKPQVCFNRCNELVVYTLSTDTITSFQQAVAAKTACSYSIHTFGLTS